ncbi:MAG: hypothetical protein WD076_02185 [Parvularculaceae bacterium]
MTTSPRLKHFLAVNLQIAVIVGVDGSSFFEARNLSLNSSLLVEDSNVHA